MEHSHRPSGGRQSNKPFKSKHATKGQLKEVSKGKVERQRIGIKARGPANRLDRRNAARINQRNRRAEVLALQRSIGGLHGAPKVVAIVPLCPDLDPLDVAERIISHDDVDTFEVDAARPGQRTVQLRNLKQRLTLLSPPPRDLFAILDALKVADFVVFAYSTTVEVDEFGELIMTAAFAQGIPSTVNVALGLADLPPKQQPEIRRALQAYINSRFREEDTKLIALNTPSDTAVLLRTLGAQLPRAIGWRETHPYMLVDEVAVDGAGAGSADMADASSDTVTLRLTGYARGGGFSANRLVHLPNYGEFQLRAVLSAADPRFPAPHRDADGAPLHVADETRESLQEENEPSPFAAEQTWPTDEEIAEAQASAFGGEAAKRTRRVPKGTSSYQAAWIVDSDEEGEDDEDGDEDGEADGDDMQTDGGDAVAGADEYDDADDDNDDNMPEGDHSDPEEYEDVAVEDRALAADQFTEEEEERQLHEYRQRREEENEDDLNFPDEVEVPVGMAARKRFAKYRGLKSFKNSPWDPMENLPVEYSKIFDFADFVRTQRNVLRAADGFGAFQYVTLVVEGVPRAYLDDLAAYRAATPLPPAVTVHGLLQHEHKVSVLHYTIKRHTAFTDVVRSKDPLILQSAFRRLDVRPIFSDSSRFDKHKYERFLHPGRVSIASIYGPISFLPCPALFFRDNGPGAVPSLVGTGALHEVKPRRIIVKRIVLTGQPFKVNKRAATVRYMFLNPEDVAWFKPVHLKTRSGRTGHIKESLGTHGYMKCLFDAPLKKQDVVCMHLYKRVYPKWRAALHKHTPNLERRPPVEDDKMES